MLGFVDNRDYAATSGGEGPGEWVVVQQFANAVDADLAKTLLDAEGIPTVLENREFIGMDWAMAAAAGWIKVLVPPDRVGEAIAVLRKANAARGPDVQLGEPGELHDAEACLRCGGAMPVGDAVCDACGWSYTEELENEPRSVVPSPALPDRDALEPPDEFLPGLRRTLVVAGVILVALALFGPWLLELLDELT